MEGTGGVTPNPNLMAILKTAQFLWIDGCRKTADNEEALSYCLTTVRDSTIKTILVFNEKNDQGLYVVDEHDEEVEAALTLVTCLCNNAGIVDKDVIFTYRSNTLRNIIEKLARMG